MFRIIYELDFAYSPKGNLPQPIENEKCEGWDFGQ